MGWHVAVSALGVALAVCALFVHSDHLAVLMSGMGIGIVVGQFLTIIGGSLTR